MSVWLPIVVVSPSPQPVGVALFRPSLVLRVVVCRTEVGLLRLLWVSVRGQFHGRDVPLSVLLGRVLVHLAQTSHPRPSRPHQQLKVVPLIVVALVTTASVALSKPVGGLSVVLALGSLVHVTWL